MRASRLLSILMLLQTRGRMTADALAEAMEVSVRTIYRDIDALSAAGVPVYGDRGPAGGFQLMDGYRTRLTGLTAEEARSVLLAGVPAAAAQLGLAEALTNARLKLLAALPDDGRKAARALGARFHLDPIPWFRAPEPAPLVAQLSRAVWEQRRIDIRYRRASGPVERRLEPLGLILKAGTWYLAARAGSQVRTYRVGAIAGLDVLEEGFEADEPFDLAEHWERAAQVYEESLLQGEALVRASARGLARLAQLGPAVEAAMARAGPEEADGRRRVSVPIEGIDQAVTDLLRAGPEIEVLAPADLREAMAKAIEELARLYLSPRPARGEREGPVRRRRTGG